MFFRVFIISVYIFASSVYTFSIGSYYYFVKHTYDFVRVRRTGNRPIIMACPPPFTLSVTWHVCNIVTKRTSGCRDRLATRDQATLYFDYRQTLLSNAPNPKTWMLLVSSCSCLCPIHWCREWIGSWITADRRCSSYICVINNSIARHAVWGNVFIHQTTTEAQ